MGDDFQTPGFDTSPVLVDIWLLARLSSRVSRLSSRGSRLASLVSRSAGLAVLLKLFCLSALSQFSAAPPPVTQSPPVRPSANSTGDPAPDLSMIVTLRPPQWEQPTSAGLVRAVAAWRRHRAGRCMSAGVSRKAEVSSWWCVSGLSEKSMICLSGVAEEQGMGGVRGDTPGWEQM